MSIQEQPVHYDIPEQKSLSSNLINGGNKEYDPFDIDDDEPENEQSIDMKCQKSESIRINNGITTNLVINNINTSSSSDQPLSLETNEQQSRSKSPPIQQQQQQQQHSKPSDRRSRSPHHNHQSSDRKRPRPSSSDSSPMNNNESTNEIISSTKHKKSSRNDERTNSKDHHHHHHRSSSRSPSTNKKSSDSKNDRSSTSIDSRRSSKRDDYHSHRSNSSRNYHSSSKYSSRDHSFSPYHDRRRSNSNHSSPSRIPSSTITLERNSSLHQNDSNDCQTSKEDQNRIYNRLKNVTVNENNTASLNPPPLPHSNKILSTGSAFTNTNGGSQRSRSNLIQIVTSEVTTTATQVPPVRSSPVQVKLESIKPISVPAIPVHIESTTIANDSSKSSTTSKTNGNTADDMLMEEMLLEEEQEHTPVKSIDLDNLTIPENYTKKPDNKDDPMQITPTTTAVTTTVTTTSTTSSTLTPSPVKKPYTLYKVPHTNHTTPPLSSRHKKQSTKNSIVTEPDKKTESTNDDSSRPTALDHRISTMLGAPPISSTEQLPQLEIRLNPSTQTSTPSDKSTESPQDIKSLIQTMVKKETSNEQRSIAPKLSATEERRSTTSKHYTTEWLASQKPEEAATEELITLPPLVALPTLVSTQPSTNNLISSIPSTGDTSMLGKLSEAMGKLIQKQTDVPVPPTTEAEDTVPISAKHLERIERRKQRENRQSEIAAIAKEALKPAFKKRTITKDEYKEIMKKVVTKATHANEVDRIRIGKMIDAYVEKYRTLRQHSISRTSTTSNGNI